MTHVIAIVAFAVVCAVWIVVQRASERFGIPGRNGACHSCGGTPGGGSCLGDACPTRGGGHDDHHHDEHEPTRENHASGVLLGALVFVALTSCQTGVPPENPPGDDRHPSSAPAAIRDVDASADLMGTRWAIRVRASRAADDHTVQRATDAAFAEVARIETVMSEWRDDSPITAVNRGAGGPVAAPEELVEIVRRGLALGAESNGAFDITWHALDALWPVHREDFVPPTDDDVEQALKLVDYAAVATTDGTVTLPRRGMELGLGAIAKGYAIDRAAAVLREAGFRSFYIDGGGDVLVSGGRGGEPWRVGIRAPRGGRTELIGIVGIEDGAVATSGDYERTRVIDGRRYHHILDPRTGYPTEGTWSVTVIAPTAEEADALATTVFVLGWQAGVAFVEERDGVECLVVDDSGVSHSTEGFQELFTAGGT